MGDFGKFAKGAFDDLTEKVPNKINDVAGIVSNKATMAAVNYDMSEKSIKYISNATQKGIKYGIYGAAGGGVVGLAVGAARQDIGVGEGTLSGAGLGGVGGIGVGAVAAAIAKGAR